MSDVHSSVQQFSSSKASLLLNERPRFLSESDCQDIARRLARYAQGGGDTRTMIESTWRGNVRWARNLISTSGEVRTNTVKVYRNLRGAMNGDIQINEVTDEALLAAVRRAERLARLHPEWPEYDLDLHRQPEPLSNPQLFSAATYQMDAEQRAEAARRLTLSAANAGMLSAGYIEVSAHSHAYITSTGIAMYEQYTWAQYSVTVRDPKGTGSGWAGVDWPAWNQIDGSKLSELALEKCLQSRNPVAVEPGRYTTILEPQAVCDFVSDCLIGDLVSAERRDDNPYHKSPGQTRLGEQVMDERISVNSNPMDSEVGFPAFKFIRVSGLKEWIRIQTFHPALWIERGVLKTLAYDRDTAIRRFGLPAGVPIEGAFHMSGGTTSVEEMVSTTKRGLLVTRFDSVITINAQSTLCRGYTRDGLWLIEGGKISKAVKNMIFTESVLFALNNVDQLGPPQRAFRPPGYTWGDLPKPVVVPPLKVRDFNFTGLADAV